MSIRMIHLASLPGTVRSNQREAAARNYRGVTYSHSMVSWKQSLYDRFCLARALCRIVFYRRVTPCYQSKVLVLLTSDDARIEYYPGLSDWWSRAEALWDANRSSDRLTLTQQLDFRRKLTTQLAASPLRAVYAKAGMHVAAAIVDDPTVIIDHTLYWATVTSRSEGLFLCAILNSPALTDLVRPLMSYGKDERHVDKHVWKLPIPLYDASRAIHQELVDLGREQAELVARMPLDEPTTFVAKRRQVRIELMTHRSTRRIDTIVRSMLR